MNRATGEQRFRQADGLFRQGHFGEALRILEELNSAYPDTRNVLFPMAMCLYRLGRTGEAAALCRRLIAVFDYGRARELLGHIQSAPTVPPPPED